MSLRVVAEKYALDSHRTKAGWLVLLVLAVGFGAAGWNAGHVYGGRTPSLADGGVQTAGLVLVPLAALGLGSTAVAGDRESGVLRVLMAYPHSRRSVVLGAFLGRLVTLLGGVGVGLVACVGAFSVRSGMLPGAPFFELAGFVVLFAVLCLAFAVGISACVSTARRAIAGALGSFLGLGFGWGVCVDFYFRQTAPRSQWYPPPEWTEVLKSLQPIGAYQNATRWILVHSSAFRTPDGVPFVQRPAFAVVIIVVWTVVPLLLGLWRFERQNI